MPRITAPPKYQSGARVIRLSGMNAWAPYCAASHSATFSL
jgi:hypothetical protein